MHSGRELPNSGNDPRSNLTRLEPEGEDLGCFSLTTLAAAATTGEGRGPGAAAVELERGSKRSPAEDPRKAEEGGLALETWAGLSLAREAARITLMEEEREAADMVARRREEGGGRKGRRETRWTREEGSSRSISQEMGRRVGF